MIKNNSKTWNEEEKDGVEAYLECTSYCLIGDHENDCKTICMERHLKANYF